MLCVQNKNWPQNIIYEISSFMKKYFILARDLAEKKITFGIRQNINI